MAITDLLILQVLGPQKKRLRMATEIPYLKCSDTKPLCRMGLTRLYSATTR